MKTKSALQWFGSDSEVAAELAALINHCKHTTIVFTGGGAIIPFLETKIVANDMHALALNFYRCMSSDLADEVIQMCEETLSHPMELQLAKEVCEGDHPGELDPQLAWAFWAQCWLGRKGKGGTKHVGGNTSVRRTAEGGNNASRIVSAAADLHSWKDQFKRCEWEQSDFRELMPKIADKPGIAWYADPPWVKAGRNYEHPFTEQDHRDLAEQARRFEHASCLIRYGDDELMRELYPESEWTWIRRQARNQNNGQTKEVWITKRCNVVV